ncbi:MAG: response regulator [Deltaproteobacteria bacterium]|nr:response regulator [Deltaproteobacteria bacterium]
MRAPVSPSATDPAFEAPSQAPAGVRILIVDDDARVRRAVSAAMSRAGFHVFTAEDGGPALVTAEQTPPDLAIVDYNMPTPGIEVVAKLKARYGRAIWITVLSGQDDEATRTACFDAGADDVVAKPASIPELRRRMLAASRTQQAFVEARLAQEQADRLMAYGAEASAMLAHDLNNGLAVALGNMEYLREVLSVEGDEAQALAATTNALRRMSGLVANFVDIARFEDAACKPHRESCNLHSLIRAVIDVHGAVKRDTRFEIVCDADASGTLDPALIERVLHNLVGNAVRYCDRGGVIRVSGRVVDSLEGSTTELQVFNSGPPIPDGARQQLFVKYGRGTNGKRGFGLYFCRLACEAHGGTIEYAPAEGGSMFAMRLPGRS